MAAASAQLPTLAPSPAPYPHRLLAVRGATLPLPETQEWELGTEELRKLGWPGQPGNSLSPGALQGSQLPLLAPLGLLPLPWTAARCPTPTPGRSPASNPSFPGGRAWPLLTMPCLTIQSLRLFSQPPPIWVRESHADGGGPAAPGPLEGAASNRGVPFGSGGLLPLWEMCVGVCV